MYFSLFFFPKAPGSPFIPAALPGGQSVIGVSWGSYCSHPVCQSKKDGKKTAAPECFFFLAAQPGASTLL